MDNVVVTGVMTNACVRFTSADAYFRDYNAVVPHECTEADTDEHFITVTESLDDHTICTFMQDAYCVVPRHFAYL